jgi:citrate lyase subunit beta/citryl-CoA lyase
MIRSALMVAGDKEKHLAKLPQLACDLAVINLEDGVFDKALAREMVRGRLLTIGGAGPRMVVRVNPLGQGGEEDIAALADVRPFAIRLPKVRNAADLQRAESLVAEGVEVHFTVETREALAGLPELRISPRVTTAYLGLLDLLTSLGIPQSAVVPGNPVIDHLMSRFLLDARLAGLTPVSFVYQDHRDLDGFEVWCKKARLMGYPGSGCISPTQVEIANRIFAPDAAQVERAREIVSLFEQAQREGVSGFDHPRHGFIDEPIYRDALLCIEGDVH